MDQACLIGGLKLGFGRVDRLVGLPVGAEIFEQFIRHGFEEGDAVGAEHFGGPGFVWVFDERVEAEQSIVELPFDGQEHAGERGAWGGDTCFAEELVAQGVMDIGAITDQIDEVERGTSGERALGMILVEIDFERAFVGFGGIDEGAVPFEAHGYIGPIDPAEGEIAGGPGEVGTEDTEQTWAGGFWIAEDDGTILLNETGDGRDAFRCESGPLVGGERESDGPEICGLKQLGCGRERCGVVGELGLVFRT